MQLILKRSPNPSLEAAGAVNMDHDLWLEEPQQCSQIQWSDNGGFARHECMAWLPEALVNQKLTGFVTDRAAEIVDSSESGLRARLDTGRSRASDDQADSEFPMELEIKLNHGTTCVKSMTHVSLLMRPLVDGIAEDALRRRYALVVRDFRASLMAEPLERRFADRVDAQFPVEVWADDGSRSKTVGTAKNVSSTGVLVLLSHAPRTREVFVRYHDRSTEDVVCAKARVIRTEAAGTDAQLCGIQLGRVSRFRKWDQRADAPDLAALGKWAPEWSGVDDAPRCDDAHAALSRPYLADPRDHGAEDQNRWSEASIADVRRLTERQRKLNSELADLEIRLRQSNAACDVLEHWWTQEAAHEARLTPRWPARLIPRFSRQRRRAEDYGLPIPQKADAPRRDKTKDSTGPLGRSVDAAAARAMLTAGTKGLREAANSAVYHNRLDRKRRRQWAWAAVVLVVAAAAAGGLVVSGVFGDPTPLLAELQRLIRSVQTVSERIYTRFSAL